MEFAGLGPPAADDDHRFADPPPHGDSMQVIRDALLSQLQKDRLRQEIIMGELAKIERAMALSSAGSHHGTASSSANPERANPAVHFSFDRQQFEPHGRGSVGPEHRVGVHEKQAVQTKKTSPAAVKKWSCGICQVEASSEGNLLQHFAGQKHRVNVIALKAVATAEKARKAGKPGPTWVCKFCPANCTGKSDLESHLQGKKHHAKIQSLLEECKSLTQDLASREANSNQDGEKPDLVSFCGICQVKCTNPLVRESHVRGKKHQMNVQALKLEAKRLGIIPPKIAKNQVPLELDCFIWQAKCNSESQFHDHCRSMGHQLKIDAMQRKGANVHSSGLEKGNKLPTDGSSSTGVSLEGEVD